MEQTLLLFTASVIGAYLTTVLELALGISWRRYPLWKMIAWTSAAIAYGAAIAFVLIHKESTNTFVIVLLIVSILSVTIERVLHINFERYPFWKRILHFGSYVLWGGILGYMWIMYSR